MKKLLVLFLFICNVSFGGEKNIILTQDNTIRLSTHFSDETTGPIVVNALNLDSRLKSGEPIYLVLDSGGGSIEAGISLINVLKNLNRPVHTISIFSASMAFQTVQGLGKRYILSNGVLMSHKAKGGFYGEFPGQFDARYSHYLKRVLKLDKIASKRANITLKKYHELIENEFWCEGIECVKSGFVDEVITAYCDKTIDGTKDFLFFRFYESTPGGLSKIEGWDTIANCPLISGIFEWKITVNNSETAIAMLPNMPDYVKQLIKNKKENNNRYIFKY